MRQKHPIKAKADKQTGGFPFFTFLSWGVLVFLVLWSLVRVLEILEPFFAPLLIAGLLASVFYPVYQGILKRFKGRENLASVTTVFIILVVVIVPLVFLTAEVIGQGEYVVEKAREWQQSGQWKKALQNDRLVNLLKHPQVDGILDRLEIPPVDEERTPQNLVPLLTKTGTKALDEVGRKSLSLAKTLFGNIFVTLINILIAFFAMFYAFRDGAKMLKYGRQMLPLKATHEVAILSQVRNVARAILVGSFLTSLSQALVAMIAFKIVGIPTLFFGLLVAVASLIPVVGTAIVWIPMVVYLYLKGQVGQAVFLFLWCSVVVGSVDNFLRPFFMKGQSGMSTIVLFFALLGGLQVYGPMGLIYGPLIFSLCAVLLYIYRLENQEALHSLEND